MAKIKIFTIKGNPEDPAGNPVPKLKMTGRQHWTPQVQRYVAWKKMVAAAYLREAEHLNPNMTLYKSTNFFAEEKPINLPKGQKIYMHIFIKWRNNARADGESVFGSIADALFKDDKYLAGSFDFEDQPSGEGSVEVQLVL